MIVGLPGETLDSWKEGHFKLLSAGQHNFIDVYPGLTLVNAELATDESREKYGIKTMRVKNPFRPDFNDVFDGIYEEGEYIVETNTLPHEDFLSCFLFSWMITNFHGYGWTEIISRWLFAKGEATYDRFYSDLYEFIQKDDFFSEFHSDYLSKLREKYSEDGFGGITYLTYAYSALIFDNFETTNKKIREFLDEYGYDVPLDVIEYNEEYVMNYNDQTDKMITFKLPVWHVINNEEFEEQDFYSYYFKNREPEEEEQELFNKRLYYMRRQGFGRFKVQPNND